MNASRSTRALLEHLVSVNRAGISSRRLGLERGIAGIAYASLLLARAHRLPRLLVEADRLIYAALGIDAGATAYVWPYDDNPFTAYLDCSVIHGPIGFWLVASLVGLENDSPYRSLALDRYLSSCSREFDLAEFSFGSSGALWGCALLLRRAVNADVQARLHEAGARLLAQSWNAFTAGRVSVTDAVGIHHLGFAHGRAGVLYAILTFCHAANRTVPRGYQAELEALACEASVSREGVSWPAAIPEPDGDGDEWPGQRKSWCNGVSGHVTLWFQAYAHFGAELYKKLALKSATYLVASPTERVDASLCCGLTGQAVALRYAAELEPNQRWDEFARHSLDMCGADDIRLTPENDGLLKGAVGALLGGEPWL